MLAPIVAVALLSSTPTFSIENRSGLTVSWDGVPVIRGSWFQYYEPGWTKGYYSSNWSDQVITKTDQGFQMTFASPDKLASGSQSIRLEGVQLVSDFEFRWNGPNKVNVELCLGMMWAPIWADGTLTIDGQKARPLNAAANSNSTMDQRTYGVGSQMQWQAPFGKLEFEGSAPGWTLFDARNYNQSWAEGRDLHWLGASAIEIQPNGVWKGTVRWKFSPAERMRVNSSALRGRAVAVKEALRPNTTPMPLLPKPKDVELSDSEFVELVSIDTRGRDTEPLEHFIDRHWSIRLPKVRSGQVRHSPDRMMHPVGGYRLTIDKQGISISASDREGRLNAARTLALLARPKDGKLVVPAGRIIDAPAIDFRGVHLFVGPTATTFQKKLWNDVLGMLKFNKAVIQCERTDWVSQPGIKTNITMPRSDLRTLAKMYADGGAEFIPLIQSFGHMGWLFANGQNRDIMFNKDVPFSIDPRHPQTIPTLAAIWREAKELTGAKTIHFGLDEVDMRGWPGDPQLVTDLWKSHVPTLAALAKELEATPMFWSDKGLAPGEAIDATHGTTPTHAKARRDALPKGALIGDWHYRAEQNPEPFRKSLQIWNEAGMKPIASTWYRPENIRGFTLAAIQEKAGLLQTTWAGYESNEANMLREVKQFQAMVLAADYAWSGRQERLEELPYDFTDVFRRLYFAPPSAVKSQPGHVIQYSPRPVGPFAQGLVYFQADQSIRLHSNLFSDPTALGRFQVRMARPVAASEIAFLLDTRVRADEGETVALIEVFTPDRKSTTLELKYGYHVRTLDDARTSLYAERVKGRSIVRMPFALGKVSEIVISPVSTYAGLGVHGVTAL